MHHNYAISCPPLKPGGEPRRNQDVICAGILVADLFANPVQRLPDPGELTTTSGLIMSVGGSAANTAVALRILGHDVDVAGKVGADVQGEFVIAELQRRGIGVGGIRRTQNCSTSGTVVLSVTGEDRRYLHCIGSNAEFELNDLNLGSLDGARVLYFGGYLALPSFTAGHLVTLFREAKSRGLITVLDVTMATQKAFAIEDVAPALAYTDYFLPNNEEAARLTGLADERSQARRLGELNADCVVVITSGARGALAIRSGRFIETPPYRMVSVDESGAGDAFAAGLITGLLKRWDLEFCLMFAAAVGASSTRTLGCFGGVFTFEEALAFVESKALTPDGTLCAGR